MAKHYLRIPRSLEDYALRVTPTEEDWRAAIFQDLTASGTELRYTPMRPNYRGPRICLWGDVFRCEASVDRDRDDALTIFHVASADTELPGEVPKKCNAEFLILTAGSTRADSVTHLLAPAEGSRATQATTSSNAGEPTMVRQVVPTDTLWRSVATIAESHRKYWQPGSQRHNPDESAVFLALCRRWWQRYSLGSVGGDNGRMMGVLSGSVTPANVDGDLRRSLLSQFDIALLNRLAQSRATDVPKLLEDMRDDLPLPEDMQLWIWALLIGHLGHMEFRRELHDRTEALLAYADGVDWLPPLIFAMKKVAATHHDSSLQELADQLSSNVEQSAAMLKSFVDRLHFDHSASNAPSPDAPLVKEPIAKLPIPGPRATSLTLDEKRVVEAWVSRTLLVDGEETKKIVSDVESVCSTVLIDVEKPDFIGQIQHLAEIARLFEEKANLWQRQLPDVDKVVQAFADATAAVEGIQTSFSKSDLDWLSNRDSTTMEDLEETFVLSSDAEFLIALPKRAWLSETTEMPTALLDSKNRRRAELFVLFRDERGLDTPSAFELALPKDASTLDMSDLRSKLASGANRTKLIETSPERDRGWLACALEMGEELAGIEQTQQMLRVAEQHHGVELVVDLLEHCMKETSSDAGGLRPSIERHVSAAARVKENMPEGMPLALNLVVYEAIQQRGASSVTSDPNREESPNTLQLDHDYVDEEGKRAPIIADTSDGAPYAECRLPLKLVSKQPSGAVLRVIAKVHGKHRDAWPAEWPKPTPDVHTLERESWRRTDSGYVSTLTALVPIRKPKAGGHLKVTYLLEQNDGGDLVAQKDLTWSELILDSEPIRLAWPKMDASLVTNHPLGPQTKHDTILSRITESKSSFAVVAPRRFGKSTLQQYIKEETSSSGFVVVSKACTNYWDGRAFDYFRLWSDVSEDLQEKLGSSMKWDRDSPLPSAAGFDYVRKAAKAQGAPGILLLLDEAHLLFSKDETLGNRLKDLIELSLQKETDEMVPIIFGIVGLRMLTERGGANLMGLLRPIEESRIRQDPLRRLISRLTKGQLATTREARERLAETSQNIYVLQTLLEELVTLLNDRRKVWASYGDVIEVEEQVYNKLRRAESQSMRQYLRDVLNDSRDVDRWEPSPSFPVALALAAAIEKGAPKPVAWCKKRLNDWLQSCSGQSSTSFEYTDSIVNEHIDDLCERGVWLRQEERFVKRSVESWLVGELSRDWLSRAENLQALKSGAIQRVTVPDGREKVGGGAQASIFKFHRDGEEFALRLVDLPTEQERVQFSETQKMLSAIQRKLIRKDAGSEYIFELQEMGLASDDLTKGVQIYRWIEGYDLSSHMGLLEESYVADLGLALAKAVELLHSYNIIHRDIRPPNIVLDTEKSRPVLIDFGLAKMQESEMRTQLASPFSAPEVSKDSPKWTRSADVFALGATLKRLSKQVENLRFQGLLESCVASNPASRPSSEQMVEELREICRELDVEKIGSNLVERLREEAMMELEAQWFNDVFIKFENRFRAIALGLHPDVISKCVELSDFIFQVVEAYPLQDGNLTALIQEERVKGIKTNTKEIKLIRHLRNERSHAKSNQGGLGALRPFSVRNERDLWQAVYRGAEKLGDLMELGALPAMVKMSVAP